jgi:hypothetical protein
MGEDLATTTLLDSGATSQFIHSNFVEQHHLTTKLLSQHIPIFNVDGSPNEAGSISEVVEVVLWYCCGRESRHTHQLPHSGLFPMEFSTWLHISRFSYTSPFFHNSHVIRILIILFFDFELQVDLYNVLEELQTLSTCRYIRFIMCHVSSRFKSSFSLMA